MIEGIHRDFRLRRTELFGVMESLQGTAVSDVRRRAVEPAQKLDKSFATRQSFDSASLV